MKTSSSLLLAGGAIASSLTVGQAAHAAGSDVIKVGLIGCGGRGAGAAVQALNTVKRVGGGEVHLTAMGDVFEDRLTGAYRAIKSQHGDLVKVTDDTKFAGLDNYQGVIAADVDLVILATPPGFRPLHFEAAVNAGKHVFMEKPVATDAPGVRRVLEAGKKAKDNNLAVAVGLQRRHEVAYQETIEKLQQGAIGDINFTRCYWNGDGVWVRPRTEKQTELEYQLRNWYYFNWICGDHIVEQHIHNIDVINWLKGGYPVSAQGVGGREVRDGVDYGQIFDHHMIEFTYADGSKCLSQCRHQPHCWTAVTEHAHGSKGTADISGGKIYDTNRTMIWKTNAERDGWQVEHDVLFSNLRKGIIQNEAEYGALSTMSSIFGRMATYSGQMLSWDEALNSDISLANVDALTSLDNEAPVKPDGNGRYPIPVPGVTKTV